MSLQERFTKGRDLQKEAGIKRTRDIDAPAPIDTNKALETQNEMAEKGYTVLKPSTSTSKKPKTMADHGSTGEPETGTDLAEKARETSKRIALHALILMSATYHLGFTLIVHPQISSHIPSCMNYFQMVEVMYNAVCENTYRKWLQLTLV